jgi:Uma2 family endonuclease
VQLRAYAVTNGGLVLASPIDIVFDEMNVLQPDIVVFSAARLHLIDLDQPIRVAPDAAVEILSPSTSRHDCGRKLRWYERLGVAEYWIVNPAARQVEVRSLVSGRYGVTSRAESDETFTSQALAGFSCAVASLLPN